MPKLGINRRRRAAGFPTASLSAAGMYFDASDFLNLYQTDDTSTPVTTVGQTVGRIAWRGAAGISAQASAGLRPTWNGNRLTFSAHYLDGTGTPMLGLFRNVSKEFTAYRMTTTGIGGAAQHVMAWSTGASAVAPRILNLLNNSGPVNTNLRRLDADATISNATVATLSNSVQYVVMTQVDWTAQTLNVYLSTDAGSETQIGAFVAVGTAGVTENTASLNQRTGASLNAAANPFAGSLYKAVADAKLMTADERAALRRWMWI